MAGTRTTKTIAKRIDLSYHKRPHPLRTLRRTLVIGCALAATLWAAFALLARSEKIYSPGPLIASHAMFEHDCSKCHDGGGTGGFLRSVSDSACLTCHDAAIHADKQITFVSTGGPRKTSANCVHCHMEHKGHDAMLGGNDLHCVQCHDNLAPRTAGGKTDVQNAIHAFNTPPAHPAFGRNLKKDGVWVDNTPLKFNHKKHLDEISGKEKLQDCTVCHRSAGTSGSGREAMLPVSYEVHCKSCHPMSLGSGLPDIPHERMEMVRLITGNIGAGISAKLAAMIPEEREKTLTVTTTRKVGLRTVTEKKALTPEEYVDAKLKPLMEKVSSSTVADLPVFKEVEKLEGPIKSAAMLELYAAYGMTTSCKYCHTIDGSPSAIAGTPLRTLPTGYHPAPASTQPTAQPSVPQATPTGRRWFTSSVFNHDAHRMMECVACHAQAKSSEKTSDLLMPDIQVCTQCHHPGGRDQRAASNNCITCHVYHDRGREAHGFRNRPVEELVK